MFCFINFFVRDHHILFLSMAYAGTLKGLGFKGQEKFVSFKTRYDRIPDDIALCSAFFLSFSEMHENNDPSKSVLDKLF